MWTVSFWKDAAERAIRTFAQVLAGFLVAGTTGVLDVDWVQAGSVAAVATLASVLMSISSIGVADEGTASLVRSDK
jgi:hypothetical protein